jgi:hypothetical protein
MNREVLNFAAIGLAILAVVTGVVLYLNRGAYVELEGSVQNVRVQAMDKERSVVVIDFRFVNSSDYPFVVRTVRVFLDDADGNRLEGTLVADSEAARLFEYFPLLGEKYNKSLIIRNRVESRESMDHMICALFEAPDSTVELRQRVLIRIEDVDGAVSEIVEEPERNQ